MPAGDITPKHNYVASQTIAHLASDPLRNFRFIVRIQNPQIKGFLQMGFMSVSGLSISTEVIPYRQGGHNTTTQKMPGQSDFAPLTMSKGLAVGSDAAMMNWMKQLFSVVQGNGSPVDSQHNFRHNVDIYVLQHPHTDNKLIPVRAAFRVYNAWPTSVAFSDLDAGANAIIVQQMTLAHEGWDFKLATGIDKTDTVGF